MSKRCPKCKETKELSEFCKCKSRSDGYGGECKKCKSVAAKIRSELPKPTPPETKICNKCKTDKPIKDFSKNKHTKYGFCNTCKECSLNLLRNWVKLPVDPISDTKHCNTCNTNKPIQEFTNNRGGSDGLSSKCRDCSRKEKFKIRYGITVEEYDIMFKNQNGRCGICNNPESENQIHNRTNLPSALAVDHCHITGKIRGLLCSGCNRGLGAFRDNPVSIDKASAYLRNGGFVK